MAVTWKIFKCCSCFRKEMVCLMFYAILILVGTIATDIIAEIDHALLELYSIVGFVNSLTSLSLLNPSNFRAGCRFHHVYCPFDRFRVHTTRLDYILCNIYGIIPFQEFSESHPLRDGLDDTAAT